MTTTYSPSDPFAVSPNHGPEDSQEEFSDELAAFDGIFDAVAEDIFDEPSVTGAESPFSLSDEELETLGISGSSAFGNQGVAGFAVSEDANTPRKGAAQAIAETLAAMPAEQREEIIRGLYGISPTGSTTANEDDPAFIHEQLKEMDLQLNRIRTSSKTWTLRLAAFELAESQNRSYVEDPKLRLRFIRSERYDTLKAAARFIRFFDFKLELFGPEALTRRITWNDLKPAERDIVKKGYTQRLPIRDRAGRAIMCHVFNGQEYESAESLARIYFYTGYDTDEETDKRGQVSVFFKIKDFTFKERTSFGKTMYMLRTVNDLPIRFEACHKMLEKHGLMNKIVDYVTQIMMPDFRGRTKIHEGSYDDWVTDLMSFGIPSDLIPYTQSYKIKTKNHQEYLSMRIKVEEMLARDPNISEATLIDLPTRSDVLLGKGKPIQFSSGNLRLMTIVDGYLDQYHNKCNKKEKTDLTFEIVRMVKESGVRFLCKDSGIWLEVPDDQARNKLSYMFRHQRTKPRSSNKSNDSLGIVRDNPTTSVDAITNQNTSKRTRVQS
ncbi:MAG: hypothetical protein SGILL_003131 [Bacillariaceae sp.]